MNERDTCPLTLEEQHRHMVFDNTVLRKVKVKQSRNRPGVAQSVPGGLGPQISMTFGT